MPHNLRTKEPHREHTSQCHKGTLCLHKLQRVWHHPLLRVCSNHEASQLRCLHPHVPTLSTISSAACCSTALPPLLVLLLIRGCGSECDCGCFCTAAAAETSISSFVVRCTSSFFASVVYDLAVRLGCRSYHHPKVLLVWPALQVQALFRWCSSNLVCPNSSRPVSA